MKWVVYVACMGTMKNACKIVIGKREGKRSLGRRRRSWKMILKWTLGKYGGKVWNGFI
jgi:hypothetical protein